MTKDKTDATAKTKDEADAKADADADAKTKADADAKTKADASKPIVKMINLSTKYSDETLQALVDLSVSKMADRKSNIIAIAYDIGANIGNSITDMPFEEHEVLISKDQIESTLNTIRSFLENDECIDIYMFSLVFVGMYYWAAFALLYKWLEFSASLSKIQEKIYD